MQARSAGELRRYTFNGGLQCSGKCSQIYNSDIFQCGRGGGGGVVLGNLRVGCSAGCFKPLPHELFTWVDRHDFVTFSILFVLVFETILPHSSEGRYIIYAVFLVRV